MAPIASTPGSGPDPTAERPSPAAADDDVDDDDDDLPMRPTSNATAYVGLGVSLLALLINPLAVTSCLGIILSIVGIAKFKDVGGAGSRMTSLVAAFAGLVLGVIATLSFVVQFVRILT